MWWVICARVLQTFSKLAAFASIEMIGLRYYCRVCGPDQSVENEKQHNSDDEYLNWTWLDISLGVYQTGRVGALGHHCVLGACSKN